MLTHEKTQLKSRTLDSNGSHRDQTLSFVDNRRNIAQRYVSVTSDNKDTGDYVTFNSIAFGHSVAGGGIDNFADSDFSKLAPNEKIAFVAHGKPGYSGKYTGDQIAEKLLNPGTGMPATDPHDIVFTSCHAGVSTTSSSDNSVVAQVQSRIHVNYPKTKVRGAMGPSVKTMSAATASSPSVEEWGVVNPINLDVAGKVQRVLEGHYGIIKLPSFALTATTTEEKAHEIQNGLRPFFEQFIHIINGEYDSVDADIIDIVNTALSCNIKSAYPQGLKIDPSMKEL